MRLATFTFSSPWLRWTLWHSPVVLPDWGEPFDIPLLFFLTKVSLATFTCSSPWLRWVLWNSPSVLPDWGEFCFVLLDYESCDTHLYRSSSSTRLLWFCWYWQYLKLCLTEVLVTLTCSFTWLRWVLWHSPVQCTEVLLYLNEVRLLTFTWSSTWLRWMWWNTSFLHVFSWLCI
jgi:hypothetical protein